MKLKSLAVAAVLTVTGAAFAQKDGHSQAEKRGDIFIETNAFDFEAIAKSDLIQNSGGQASRYRRFSGEMMNRRIAAALLFAAAASGCASSVYEGKHAWDEGWRRAVVVKVGQASELGGRHSSDCRYKLTPEQVASFNRFVVVSFLEMSRQRRGVLPIAANAPEPKPGDLVYANVLLCDQGGLEPRPEDRKG